MRFKRESDSLLHLKNLIYVLGLKKKLVFVAILEDKGYAVVFNKEKAYLKNSDLGQFKQIRLRV